MRALAIFCVIVVMVLNMVPCADAHDHADAPIALSFSSSDHAKSHEAPLEDACTPFCHCSCCASSIVLKLVADLNPPFSIHQTSIAMHFEGRSIAVSHSVWQPPKLV
ncbi:DUF6660 family protein [Pedobacter frigoris]|uniref:DUF2946 domain-containing protein n=1 Tax=Pedobacter frigoris TaxID=2571272 RepID=A0A4U1CMR1_9SPHI|nr:DUF6660 family protein [Pedobacter frigoris]TKC08703.1 hypothetical protein FA047_00975 [Pedobacter frigoris]